MFHCLVDSPCSRNTFESSKVVVILSFEVGTVWSFIGLNMAIHILDISQIDCPIFRHGNNREVPLIVPAQTQAK